MFPLIEQANPGEAPKRWPLPVSRFAEAGVPAIRHKFRLSRAAKFPQSRNSCLRGVMSNQIQISRLQKAADALFDELEKRELPDAFRLRRGADPIESDSGGWALTVAKWGSFFIQIFLDRFINGRTPHFWVGFFSARKLTIEKLIESLPAEF